MTEDDNIYFKEILKKVHDERGIDFSQYKDRLLLRRVMYRVRIVRLQTFKEYLDYINSNPAEIDDLLDFLTINVTEFFRDHKVFDKIESVIIPEIVEKKRTTHDARRTTINIWSCACSTGQEVYSLLILLSECLGTRLSRYNIKLYATDIDQASLQMASEGVFNKSEMEKWPENKKNLVDKYFYELNKGRYWIREEWSPYVEIRYHDVTSDPPLENMDLILCRNMLMYFSRELQDQVFVNFSRALNKGGFLILGIVESILGGIRSDFSEFDRQCRIYQKK